MRTSVIIVTLNRPECVRRCIECLRTQNPSVDQIIVVDSSVDTRTRDIVLEFNDVLYLRNEAGYGRMTASRNIGIRSAYGEIIAFLDDDAFAHDGWLAALLDTYRRFPRAGAVGGRAVNGAAGEENDGIEQIGKLTRSGLLLGNFAADCGRIIEVDHIMGCNMSFKREVIKGLGGFREDYPGISGVREDSDMCLRVKLVGYSILFNPLAVATHIGAPQAKGSRFDLTYTYYAARNHVVLLIRNFGVSSRELWAYFLWLSRDVVKEVIRRVSIAIVRAAVVVGGTVLGIFSGVKILASVGRSPERRDAESDRLRADMDKCLGQHSAACVSSKSQLMN